MSASETAMRNGVLILQNVDGTEVALRGNYGTVQGASDTVVSKLSQTVKDFPVDFFVLEDDKHNTFVFRTDLEFNLLETFRPKAVRLVDISAERPNQINNVQFVGEINNPQLKIGGVNFAPAELFQGLTAEDQRVLLTISARLISQPYEQKIVDFLRQLPFQEILPSGTLLYVKDCGLGEDKKLNIVLSTPKDIGITTPIDINGKPITIDMDRWSQYLSVIDTHLRDNGFTKNTIAMAMLRAKCLLPGGCIDIQPVGLNPTTGTLMFRPVILQSAPARLSFTIKGEPFAPDGEITVVTKGAPSELLGAVKEDRVRDGFLLCYTTTDGNSCYMMFRTDTAADFTMPEGAKARDINSIELSFPTLPNFKLRGSFELAPCTRPVDNPNLVVDEVVVNTTIGGRPLNLNEKKARTAFRDKLFKSLEGKEIKGDDLRMRVAETLASLPELCFDVGGYSLSYKKTNGGKRVLTVTITPSPYKLDVTGIPEEARKGVLSLIRSEIQKLVTQNPYIDDNDKIPSMTTGKDGLVTWNYPNGVKSESPMIWYKELINFLARVSGKKGPFEIKYDTDFPTPVPHAPVPIPKNLIEGLKEKIQEELDKVSGRYEFKGFVYDSKTGTLKLVVEKGKVKLSDKIKKTLDGVDISELINDFRASINGERWKKEDYDQFKEKIRKTFANQTSPKQAIISEVNNGNDIVLGITSFPALTAENCTFEGEDTTLDGIGKLKDLLSVKRPKSAIELLTAIQDRYHNADYVIEGEDPFIVGAERTEKSKKAEELRKERKFKEAREMEEEDKDEPTTGKITDKTRNEKLRIKSVHIEEKDGKTHIVTEPKMGLKIYYDKQTKKFAIKVTVAKMGEFIIDDALPDDPKFDRSSYIVQRPIKDALKRAIGMPERGKPLRNFRPAEIARIFNAFAAREPVKLPASKGSPFTMDPVTHDLNFSIYSPVANIRWVDGQYNIESKTLSLGSNVSTPYVPGFSNLSIGLANLTGNGAGFAPRLNLSASTVPFQHDLTLNLGLIGKLNNPTVLGEMDTGATASVGLDIPSWSYRNLWSILLHGGYDLYSGANPRSEFSAGAQAGLNTNLLDSDGSRLNSNLTFNIDTIGERPDLTVSAGARGEMPVSENLSVQVNVTAAIRHSLNSEPLQASRQFDPRGMDIAMPAPLSASLTKPDLTSQHLEASVLLVYNKLRFIKPFAGIGAGTTGEASNLNVVAGAEIPILGGLKLFVFGVQNNQREWEPRGGIAR